MPRQAEVGKMVLSLNPVTGQGIYDTIFLVWMFFKDGSIPASFSLFLYFLFKCTIG